MKRSVHICGLYRQDLAGVTWQDLTADGSQVWTLNDWYRCYSWMKPHRVFNLQTMEHLKENVLNDDHRYPGDWMEIYKGAAECGTVFVLLEEWGIQDQQLLPADELLDAYPHARLCGISAMILCAVLEGFQKISLKGVQLRDNEYKYQLTGITQALAIARNAGVEVDNPRETEWAIREGSMALDVELIYDKAISLLAERLRVDTDVQLTHEPKKEQS